MKNLFFLAVFILISPCIKAQDDDDARLPKALDSLLLNIDKSSVTSGIIYERTMQMANLYNFNTKEFIDTANFDYFRQSLLEMYRASNGKRFISLNELDENLNNSSGQNIVNVGILNTQFNVLNYNEENPQKGGLILDSIHKTFVQIPDIPPFYMMHNTVISPLKNALDGKDVRYRFSKNFFFNNGQKLIISLIANFGNGEKIPIITNGTFIEQELIIKYATSGIQTLTFDIVYGDGSTLVTHAELYYNNSNLDSTQYSSCTAFNNDALHDDFINIPADEEFTGYLPGDPRILPEIDYRIYYANGNTQKLLKKPLIIIDGFDPGDKRRIEDCDCAQDSDCANRHRDANGQFDAAEYKSIYDMMVYYPYGDTPAYLLPQLRSLGYDVIIVNFPNYRAVNLNTGIEVPIDGGAYYIESNALGVVKLIKDVNVKLQTNGSTNQIAIIAPSMAGQVSRYALSYMEKKFLETSQPAWQHNVYLWVSVDSPHLGANIPLGDQSLLYLARSSSSSAADFYDNQLSSPAAKQQLIEFHKRGMMPNPFNPSVMISSHHVVDPAMLNAQTTSQGLSQDRGNSFYQMHYNAQNSNGIPGSDGWPQNLRKIAVVNGSLTGSKETQDLKGKPFLNFAKDGEKVLNIRGFQRIHISLGIGSVTFYIHVASLESEFLESPFKTDQIARFKKSFSDKTTVATNINPRGVMDNVPGGFFDSQAQIAGPVLSKTVVPGTNYISSFSDISITNFIFALSQSLGGSRWFLHEFNPINSFIPTFSSIAHLEPNQNWNNPLNYNLACESDKKTPFDSYFGIAKNTPHTSFTPQCVTWILKELDHQPQLPSYPVRNLAGPDLVCVGANGYFSFGNDICALPSPVANWHVSDNLNIVSSGDMSITINPNAAGSSYITAVFSDGSYKTRTFWAGAPEPISELETIDPTPYPQVTPTMQNDCSTIGFEVNFKPSNGDVLEILWDKITDDVQWQRDYVTDNSRRVFLYPECNKRFDFRVKARNSCGWSEWFDLHYDMNSCPQNCSEPFSGVIGDNYILTPNPVTSTGMLTINVKDMAPLFTTLVHDDGTHPSTNPNPEGGDYYVTNFHPTVNVSIYSVSGGGPILVFPSVHLTGNLDISTLPTGTYIVEIEYMGLTESIYIIRS